MDRTRRCSRCRAKFTFNEVVLNDGVAFFKHSGNTVGAQRGSAQLCGKCLGEGIENVRSYDKNSIVESRMLTESGDLAALLWESEGQVIRAWCNPALLNGPLKKESMPLAPIAFGASEKWALEHGLREVNPDGFTMVKED